MSHLAHSLLDRFCLDRSHLSACFQKLESVARYLEERVSSYNGGCGDNAFPCDADTNGLCGCCCDAGYQANQSGHCQACEVSIPWKCAAAMIAGAGVSVASAPVLLAAAGFTSAGIAGGSLAALWQSHMAAVSGGSLFAWLQSISMAGLGTTGSLGLGGAAGAAAMGFCKAADRFCDGCIDHSAMECSPSGSVESSLIPLYRFLEDQGLGSAAKDIVKSSGAQSLEDLIELDTEAVSQITREAGLTAVLASKLRKALKVLLKRNNPGETNESVLMLQSVNDVNLAKFLDFDVPLYNGITRDLFPGVDLPKPDYSMMVGKLTLNLDSTHCQAHPYFIDKIIQFYECHLVRHSVMLVGMPFSGKTTALKTLQKALTDLAQEGLMHAGCVVHQARLNPKSIPARDLYGCFEEVSREWVDGIVAVLFREFARNQTEERKWLVFDGPVDAVWIENMNTVMDENKKLCLNSGEIIAMSPNMRTIIEPMDVEVASPATISRNGMVEDWIGCDPHPTKMELRCSALVAIAVQMLITEAAICGNWNETQCPSMNDGGCSCYWNSTTCAKNNSDCSGVGITSVSDNCTLTGGEVVTDGWSGNDTGTNWCNSCNCGQGTLACTLIGCIDPNDNCTLTGGEVVTDGWSGKDTGTNWCNSCSCGQGMLACTEIGCIDPDANGTLQTSNAGRSELLISAVRRIAFHVTYGVFFEPHLMGYQHLIDKTLKGSLPQEMEEAERTALSSMIDFLVPALVSHVQKQCRTVSPVQEQNLVQSFLVLLTTHLESGYKDPNMSRDAVDGKAIVAMVDCYAIWCAIWSFGAVCETSSRSSFSQFLRKLLTGQVENNKPHKKLQPNLPDRGSVFDYIVDLKQPGWTTWMDTVEAQTIPNSAQVQNIIVQTVDNVRYRYILEHCIKHRIKLLFCGPTGTGKTVYMQQALMAMPKETHMSIQIGFSAQTKCSQTQDLVDAKLERRRKGIYGPPMGRMCVVMVDDLNMPVKEKYGAMPPIEILRQSMAVLAMGDGRRSKPNLVLILLDDQDQVLGGMDPYPNIQRLLGKGGTNFTNFFVNTPVCCPSRAELMGGRYGHNNLVGDLRSSGGSKGCMWANVTGSYFVQNQLGSYLSKLGYTNGLFGKYMNSPACSCPVEAGCRQLPKGDQAVPPGWDRWFALCKMGKYFSNSYNDDGQEVSTGDAPQDYMTSVIGNRTIEWLHEVAGAGRPFFAYVAPRAPHIADAQFPYITQAAPWHAGAAGHAKAPRTPNWNVPNAGAHPLISSQPKMDDLTVNWSDSLYRSRVESMLSVDDLVAEVFHVLDSKGVLDNTVVLLTSDHGYALGQQARPSGKFNVYDNDIRVPMLLRGPGIQPGARVDAVSGIVDIAPTLVELAGGDPDIMELDGRSLVPLLGNRSPAKWRKMYPVEYWSLGNVNRGFPQSPQCNPSEGADCKKSWCTCHYHRVDGENNTYLAARYIAEDGDFLLANFYADRTPSGDLPRIFHELNPVFTEFYDLKADPWQMNNLYPQVEAERPSLLRRLRRVLFAMNRCSGRSCREADVEDATAYGPTGGWYDRKDATHPFRSIIDVLYFAAMGPPGGGRNFITPRIIGHMYLVGFPLLDDDNMMQIFNTILEWKFRTDNYPADVAGLSKKMVQATLEIYKNTSNELRPTPMKVHYTFNLRDFSKVISGVLLLKKNECEGPDRHVRLWAHEILRVFGDRLIDDNDREWMLLQLREQTKKNFQNAIFQRQMFLGCLLVFVAMATNFWATGRKIVAVGKNYQKHIEEMAQIGSKKDEKFLSEAPQVPVLFLKPTSSYLPMGSGPIRLPRNIGPVHHEVELGIVIGQKCKRVKESEALGVVAGYCLALDLTARDLQLAAKEKGMPWSVPKGY
ncbi:DNAH7, partial [Symbiodinium necroappetens]